MTKAGVKLLEDQRFEALLTQAYLAADTAQAGMVENPRAFDCGFAWVVVNPATHPFVGYCKRQLKLLEAEAKASPNHETRDNYAQRRRYGSKHYAGGWSFWCPGNFNGQAIGIHEAGAKAFRNTIALDPMMGGARVETGSRYD